jgi:hypothetical protein
VTSTFCGAVGAVWSEPLGATVTLTGLLAGDRSPLECIALTVKTWLPGARRSIVSPEILAIASARPPS